MTIQHDVTALLLRAQELSHALPVLAATGIALLAYIIYTVNPLRMLIGKL